MARYSQTYEFYRQSPSALDTKTPFSEEEDMSILDDKILDPTTPDISTINDPRRPSFDRTSDDFSSRGNMWPEYSQQSANAQSRHSSHLTNPLFETHNNPFVRLEASQAAAYGQQVTWAMNGGSGSCTPTPIYENFPQEYDSGTPTSFPGGAVGGVNGMAFSQIPYRPGSGYTPTSAIPMSPQSSQGGWMSTTSSDVTESRSRPARSPTYRVGSPQHMRRDGIRKKNARFEIPAERTLSNIDNLISQANDDTEIKELKQQKRLLRNRQAALDSRQRKKQHTEKLEEEKKHFSTVVQELEDALQQLKVRDAEHMRQRAEWQDALQQSDHIIHNLVMEKEEMIRQHTLETGELRKKNNVYREHIEKLERQTMSAPSSAGFSGEFSDFENLTMDTPWEDFSMVNGFDMETDPPKPTIDEVPLPLPKKTADDKKSTAAADLPFSWNAFYMCLLFGAFIASNSSSISTPAIPPLSDEYRAESANVLKAVLASAPPSSEQPQHVHALIPASSASTSQHPPATITSAEMARLTSGPGGIHPQPSTLDVLHTTLITPSKHQEEEQIFSLNADQYNSLTHLDDDDDDIADDDYADSKPTNLQQALAAMRPTQNYLGAGKAADVYSRSLLWDRVPEKVVRDFRRMVRECGGGQDGTNTPSN